MRGLRADCDQPADGSNLKKDDPVMIFAGYPAEMKEFCSANPGFDFKNITTPCRDGDYCCKWKKGERMSIRRRK